VDELSTACPVLVQGYPPLRVLDPDALDRLVDTILEHVNASIIATNMLNKAKEDNPVVAHDVLQELNNAPTELQAAADLKTFSRRHTLLRMSISRADAPELQIRKNVARHSKLFAMEDPLMTAEVCSLLKTWRSLQWLCPSPKPLLLLIILLAASCGQAVRDWFPLGTVIQCSL
jgi:hypothetical protein